MMPPVIVRKDGVVTHRQTGTALGRTVRVSGFLNGDPARPWRAYTPAGEAAGNQDSPTQREAAEGLLVARWHRPDVQYPKCAEHRLRVDWIDHVGSCPECKDLHRAAVLLHRSEHPDAWRIFDLLGGTP